MSFGSIRSALILLALLAAGGCGDPAGPDSRGSDAVSAAGLPEVPAVNTADMLPAVREQVEAARARLQDAPTDSAANGRYAMLLQAYGLNQAAAEAYTRTRAVDRPHRRPAA